MTEVEVISEWNNSSIYISLILNYYFIPYLTGSGEKWLGFDFDFDFDESFRFICTPLEWQASSGCPYLTVKYLIKVNCLDCSLWVCDDSVKVGPHSPPGGRGPGNSPCGNADYDLSQCPQSDVHKDLVIVSVRIYTKMIQYTLAWSNAAPA